MRQFVKSILDPSVGRSEGLVCLYGIDCDNPQKSMVKKVGGKIETMSVRIRLARGGRKKRPFYQIVVATSEAPRDGRFIEGIGTYNPLPEEPEVRINAERLEYWLQQGAKPSDTVRNLIRKYCAQTVAEA